MNALRKEIVAVDRIELRLQPSQAPMEARPVKNPRSYEDMLAHAKKRFSKTLAYLAK